MINTGKFGKLQKKYTQNLTQSKIFNSKSDVLLKSWSKIWRVLIFLIQNLTRCICFQSKMVRVVKVWKQNLTRCKNFVSKSTAFENFNWKLDKFQNFFSEIWFSSCSSRSDWTMISSVNVNNKLILKRRIKRDCVRPGLVARCTTETCHTSLRLSLYEK